MDADERLRAGRLAAQRLTPATACKSAEEAALAVIGVQAQDLRAAALALRSRVPGLTRSAVRAAPLLRTWTVRGASMCECAVRETPCARPCHMKQQSVLNRSRCRGSSLREPRRIRVECLLLDELQVRDRGRLLASAAQRPGTQGRLLPAFRLRKRAQLPP